MHSHVIRTETKRLAACMNEWVDTGPEDPAEVGNVQAHYMGGRDWVVTVVHEHAPIPEHGGKAGHTHHSHGTEDPDALAEIGAPTIVGTMSINNNAIVQQAVNRAQLGKVRVETVPMGGVPGQPPEYGALIEDEARTWALWVDANGCPASMWTRREADGAVIAPGVGFDGGLIFTVDETLTPYPDTYATDAPPPTEPDPAQREEYLNWALRQRSHYWNWVVSARETLRQLGWPSADNSEVPIHVGISWLAERTTQRVAPRYHVQQDESTRNYEVVVDYVEENGEGGREVSTSTVAAIVRAGVAYALAELLNHAVQHPTAHLPLAALHAVAPGGNAVDLLASLAEEGALDSAAAAYHDAVAALHEVTHAPLSTTIGHLIRQGWLRPSHPRGKFFVRFAGGQLTVDGVPVPDEPGKWDVMTYVPAPSALLSNDAKREIVQAVGCTLRSLTHLPVDEAVLD